MNYNAVFFFPNRNDNHGRKGVYKFRLNIDLDTVKQLMRYTKEAEESVRMYAVRAKKGQATIDIIDEKPVRNLWAHSAAYDKGMGL